MSWVSALPAAAVAVALFVVPGLLVGVALGVRGLRLLAVAPAFSVSVIAVASLANHVLGFRWSLLPVALVAILLSALVALIVRLARPDRDVPPGAALRRPATALAAVGLVFAFGAIAARFVDIIGTPSNISQTFDNVFHLNAIRWILDTGIASPFKIGALNYQYDERISFYPDMWHAVVALVVQASGSPIPIAVTATNVVIGGLLWPLGCVLLVRQIAGPRPIALLAAGVLSAGFSTFPYLMIDFGVLYPNLLSIALLPTALAVVLMTARVGLDRPLAPWRASIALLGVLPGLALAHPTTLMALITFSIPIGVVVVIRSVTTLRRRGAGFTSYARVAAIALLAYGAAAVALLVVRPPEAGAFWGPRESFVASVVSALTSAPVSRPPDLVMMVLLLVGLWVAVRRPEHVWAVGMYLLGAGLYIVCASFPPSSFRSGLTAVWYNDSYRLAALLPVVVLPLAALGADRLATAGAALVRRVRARGPGSTPSGAGAMLATGVVLCVALAAAAQLGRPLASASASASASYRFAQNSPLLSPDELALLERIDDEVPPDESVIGSPWTGTSLVYAVADRRALLPHIFGDRDPETVVLLESLRDSTAGSAVCDAVEDLAAYWVLDFGDREVHGGDNVIPGLEDLEDSDAVELTDEEGAAKLFHVTACG